MDDHDIDNCNGITQHGRGVELQNSPYATHSLFHDFTAIKIQFHAIVSHHVEKTQISMFIYNTFPSAFPD